MQLGGDGWNLRKFAQILHRCGADFSALLVAHSIAYLGRGMGKRNGQPDGNRVPGFPDPSIGLHGEVFAVVDDAGAISMLVESSSRDFDRAR